MSGKRLRRRTRTNKRNATKKRSKRSKRSKRKESLLKRQVIARYASTKPEGQTETLVPLDLLEKQVKKGEELNLHENVPTIETMRKMNRVVEDYLKKTERIIYGGTAIDALLKAKGFQVRDTEALIDYDFYSPLYEVDTISIANELYEKGYKYVRRVPAIHPYTFRVGAEFAPEFIADVTYIPSKVYSKIPKIKIGDFYYIDPQFAKIDLYKSVTNPHTNVVRWVKSYKRLIAMEHWYPIAKGRLAAIHVPDSLNPKLQETIKRFAKNGKGLLASGMYAYNLFTSLVPGMSGVNVQEYEFYAVDPLAESKRLITTLKRNGFKNSESKEFYDYLEIFPRKTVVYFQKQPVASFYLIGENCIGVREIDRTRLVNYHVLLMFLYGKYCVDGIINKDKTARNLYSWLIQSLMTTFDEYNKIHGTRGLESGNPFRIFQIDCLSYDPEEARLSAYKRNFYGIRGAPLYKPEKVRINPEQLNEIYLGNFLGEEVNPSEVKRQMSRLEEQYKQLGMAAMKKAKV